MDDSGDVVGLTVAERSCGSCGTRSGATARFCSECGTPLTQDTRSAEYKQVTVLFADVVHSMDIAALVGAERLREIMTDLVSRAAVVVQRYGGTVDKFTGDGIMAVFGAPAALEDHAVRACLAALGIQEEAKRLGSDVQERDGVELQLRVGLNSGQVIAGEIGSGPFGYTAVGEQVGMAQRMESVAPPGGVMLSESTARLVEHAAWLGEPELVSIKGSHEPVTAHRLLGVAAERELTGRSQPTLVGRDVELHTITGMFDRSVSGHGCVIGVAGPAGIGKSRLVGETVALAKNCGVEVFSAFCESHTREIPFHVAARLLRAVGGITGLDGETARARVRAQVPDADPEDVMLLYDLLGIRDPDVALPNIDPDARRRRLSALINSVSLARTAPAVYIIEDAHWIDEVSESMFADFLTVIPQTHSTVLITYRPEYRGTLARAPGAQTISLAPLTDSDTTALLDELLGRDSSVAAVSALIAGRAAGNPFFAEEIVRELAERGVLRGVRGAYLSTAEVAEVSVPATLQATIAARIDRLEPNAKRTLGAAAVIGLRFGLDLLTVLGVEPVVAELVAAQFVDQVKFTRQPEFVFHHPLIRAVAYEAQLKSDRAEMHRRLASVIEQRDHDAVGEHAALIAEHLEAAGDLRCRVCLAHARRCLVRQPRYPRRTDQLGTRPAGGGRATGQRSGTHGDAHCPENAAVYEHVAGRAWRRRHRFRGASWLCASAGDDLSLAIGMFGQMTGLNFEHRHREASVLASEQIRLLEESPDALRAVGVIHGAAVAKVLAGEAVEAYRFAQWCIDLVGDDPAKGRTAIIGSPLAFALLDRGLAGCSLGRHDWHNDIRSAIAMQRSATHTGWRCWPTTTRCGKPPKLCGLPKSAATMSPSKSRTLLKAWC